MATILVEKGTKHGSSDHKFVSTKRDEALKILRRFGKKPFEQITQFGAIFRVVFVCSCGAIIIEEEHGLV